MFSIFWRMRLDVAIEQDIKAFMEKEKMTAKVVRELVLKVEGIK